MEKIHLKDYVKKHGQYRVARDLNVSQGAISKALRNNRNIFVFCKNEKVVSAEEVRSFPAQ